MAEKLINQIFFQLDDQNSFWADPVSSGERISYFDFCTKQV